MAKSALAYRDDSQQLLIRDLKTPKEAFREIRNYLAGQHIGATRDDALLDEVLKCLFCKLYIETSAADPVPPGADVFAEARHIRAVFAKVRKDFADIYDEATEIMLDPESIHFVLKESYFSLVDSHSDPIGDAFEVFAGSDSRSRAGQFFTPRSVTDLLIESLDPQPGETIIDPACGAGGFLTSAARHLLANGVGIGKLSSLVSSTFYGIDKDEYLVKLAKLHISLLTRAHPTTIWGDSLSQQNGSKSLKEILPRDGFDVLVTNPPFGVRIVAAKPEVLKTFELARKWIQERGSDRWKPTGEVRSQVPPQVLFVERCLSLLKEGGRLGMVLPESLLSNKSYRYVMEYLQQKSEIQAVIGMPESLFKTSGKGGTHTKTCLVVARRRSEGNSKSKVVFMAEAKWCGQDSRARTIPYNDLPQIAENFTAFRKKKLRQESQLGFTVQRDQISSNVFCPRYYDPQVIEELRRLEKTHDLYKFGDLVEQGTLSVATGDELGKLAYGTGDIPFIRTSDISNWEMKADPKHGVDRAIYDSFRRKQDVRPLDVLMVKDGTYLIGTCAIVTEADREMIYQSHLYKIRVNLNDIGLTPYLLLAVLSCPLVQRQVKAKQFTQDIIDSLGERINELVLPLPKSQKQKNEIATMVEKSMRLRIEARDLARRARAAVTAH
jgi:type I restriction enzyme M protein